MTVGVWRLEAVRPYLRNPCPERSQRAAPRFIEIPREHRGKVPIAPLPSISTNFFDKRRKNASNHRPRQPGVLFRSNAKCGQSSH